MNVNVKLKNRRVRFVAEKSLKVVVKEVVDKADTSVSLMEMSIGEVRLSSEVEVVLR